VTELRLESAGGSRPEAVMNVITLAEAARLEAVLRGQAAASAEERPAELLLALDAGEILRLGLVDQRGMVVVGAAIAFVMQVEPWREAMVAIPQRIAEEARDAAGSPLAGLGLELWLGAAGLLLAAWLALQVLSVGRAFVAFHRFRLLRRGERITTEAGLFTLQVASARRDKVQRLLAGESWLARRLGRRRLSCEVAAGAGTEGPGPKGREARCGCVGWHRWPPPSGSPSWWPRCRRGSIRAGSTGGRCTPAPPGGC
jgi:putative membrane protein